MKKLARESIKEFADDSWEFCKLMHQLIPKVVVFPYRLCDGGSPVLRATFRLQTSALLEEPRAREVLEKPLERILTLDLVDQPQRAAYREQIMQLRQSGQTERQAARECGITVTAAQRAAVLQRKMDDFGITDPYVCLTAPPDDYRKLRRHKHPRYRFEPLPDAGQF